jgi:hypothetical protein
VQIRNYETFAMRLRVHRYFAISISLTHGFQISAFNKIRS